jgi:hypothetical protein
MPGGVGGVAQRGVPLSRSLIQGGKKCACQYAESRSQGRVGGSAIEAQKAVERRFRSSSARLSGKFPQVAGVERYFEDVDAAGGQLKCVLDRLGEQGAYRNGSGFTHPLDAQLVVG